MTDPRRRVRRPARFVLASLAVSAALLAAGLSQPAPAAAAAPTSAEIAVMDTADATDGGAPADVTTVSTGWQTPWDITFMPDGRSALVTQRLDSQVFRLDRDGTKKRVGEVPYTVPEPYDDGPGGLLGVAPSPTWNGKTDKQVFFVHTTRTETRIVRMDYDGKSLSHYKTLITGIKRIGNHNGGQIVFGPDGYLYVSTGEAYQPKLAQDKKSLNGKILRITRTGAAAPGNPFGNRVYSYGHRNPEGLAFDSNGHLWEAEIGDQTWDEVNLIKPGGNYGWPTCEGSCGRKGLTDPSVVFAPGSGGVPAQIAVVHNVLYVSCLRGKRLWRIPIDGNSERVGKPVDFYAGQFGRLRGIAKVPGSDELWLGTSDAGYGKDKILRVSIR
ncbi:MULTISPECIES: PQQ-dependent sugar dehydrogenase [unclassified Streptomyces]|uniref:PQQ-dependent sugar dehydrogenase n=1 Tax=unclassified Streptomyces TaxID=2593676 RepID=UPI002E17DA68|nr:MULTISPECIES: PQQ-dependent sugar dehydrogenase [unclassified Streptomyces]